MRVQYRYPAGAAGWDRAVEADLVPREDETVEVGDETYRVRHVVWYPFGDDDDGEPSALVVLRSLT